MCPSTTSMPTSDAEVSSVSIAIVPPSIVMPLPELRPPSPAVRWPPVILHADSQRIPSFQPITEMSSMKISDQTARRPTEVVSVLEKARCNSINEREACTSRRTIPSSSARSSVSLISSAQPEIEPPSSNLNVESVIINSPEPDTSNNLLLYCTDISLMFTVPAPRRRAKVPFALISLTGKPEPTNANSPSI